jgi:hypothetical protein
LRLTRPRFWEFFVSNIRNPHTRRALAAGIAITIVNHSFRVTGITRYLTNGATLEKAATIVKQASTRTTRL